MKTLIRYSMLLATFAVVASGCGTTFQVIKHPVTPVQTMFHKIDIDFTLAGSPGTSGYVENMLVQALKKNFPTAVQVDQAGMTTDAVPSDVRIVINMLTPIVHSGWYTALSFGFVKEYVFLGSARVVDSHTGNVLHIYEMVARHRDSSSEFNQDDWAEVVNELLRTVKTDLAQMISSLPPCDTGVHVATR